MNESGKIVFYNMNDGHGMIITPEKGKFPFSVVDWDDYDQMPSVGLQVEFKIDGKKAIAVRAQKKQATAVSETPVPAKKSTPVIDNSYRKRFDELMNDYEQPSSIKLSMNPLKCIKDYFTEIDNYIESQSQYNSSHGRLNFLLMRRFIFTTFNNLIEMDMNFITPQIKKVKNDILHMSHVYDDFKTKNSYPDTAFEKIFLEAQKDYVKIELECAEVSHELQILRKKEQVYERTMLQKQKEMKELSGSSLRTHEEVYKGLKGTYVDIVHMCASLEERLRSDMEMMSEFRNVYKESFIKSFKASSQDYEKLLLHTLDAQAYIFDMMLWEKAKKSRVIKRFFSEAQIHGEFNSATYLRYYLNALDKEKASDEHKELFKLYEYLKTRETYTTVILSDDIDEVLELKRIVSSSGVKMLIKTFIDDKNALMWAVLNHANVFIIKDELQHMSAMKFLENFKKSSEIKAKVMILSNHDVKTFESDDIDCVIKHGESAKEITRKIKTMLGVDDG